MTTNYSDNFVKKDPRGLIKCSINMDRRYTVLRCCCCCCCCSHILHHIYIYINISPICFL